MTCRCRDMEKKTCRKEYSNPSSWNQSRKQELRDRRTTNKHDRKKADQ